MSIPCSREPDLPLLEQSLRVARSFRPDCVVGLGGGAALDLGKALAGLILSSGPVLDHLEVVGRSLPLTVPPVPFIAVPTTSGTGAEATKNAVVGVPEHRRKVSLRDDRMLARVAIIDPGLSDGCPRGVTLASGLDALTQVIEPYVCSRANLATDAFARPAIRAASEALKILMMKEDPNARDQMAWASFSGGVALANSGLGAVHGLAGVIGGLTGAAHGAICGTLLPFVISANRRALPDDHPLAQRLNEVSDILAQVFGGDGEMALHHWSRDCGLPGLFDLGLPLSDHDAVAQAALSSSSMKSNPAALSQIDLREILHSAG
jgi:alcohol dehydrogenase class IV